MVQLLNKDIQSKDPRITDPSSTHSIPSLSPPPAGTAAASPPERKGTEAATQSAVEIYRDIIKENIEYDHLLRHSKIDREELDGIVELLVETVCTARKTIRVAGDDYPAELVKGSGKPSAGPRRYTYPRKDSASAFPAHGRGRR